MTKANVRNTEQNMHFELVTIKAVREVSLKL